MLSQTFFISWKPLGFPAKYLKIRFHRIRRTHFPKFRQTAKVYRLLILTNCLHYTRWHCISLSICYVHKTKSYWKDTLLHKVQGRPASVSCKILLFTQLHCWVHLMGKHGNITHFQQLFFHLIARQYCFLVYFTKYSQFFNFIISLCWSIFNQNYYTIILNVFLPHI